MKDKVGEALKWRCDGTKSVSAMWLFQSRMERAGSPGHSPCSLSPPLPLKVRWGERGGHYIRSYLHQPRHTDVPVRWKMKNKKKWKSTQGEQLDKSYQAARRCGLCVLIRLCNSLHFLLIESLKDAAQISVSNVNWKHFRSLSDVMITKLDNMQHLWAVRKSQFHTCSEESKKCVNDYTTTVYCMFGCIKTQHRWAQRGGDRTNIQWA